MRGGRSGRTKFEDHFIFVVDGLRRPTEGMVSMEKHDYFTDHFEVFLIASNIALMAIVILFMALSTTFRLGLLIASALSLVIGLELFAYCVKDHFQSTVRLR
jgi:hypothetical protein